MRARLVRLLGCGLLIAFLAGCAALEPLVPQTVALRGGWPAGVPQSVELDTVPFFPQDDFQCGPAALATVLAWTGVAVTPQALVDQVWLPARQGSLQAEMLAAARARGRLSYQLAPRYGDLLREVAAGNPVIVLQDVGPLGTQWHYAVVVGFDYPSGTIYLRSGTDRRQAMPFTAFERSWLKGGYWAMVALPPNRVAASAVEDRWMEAVLAFTRIPGNGEVAGVAYAATLREWPDNVPAAIGLANDLHDKDAFTEAADVLRAALERHPYSMILMNNLAQTLSDQGLQREALEMVDRALEQPSPFAAEIRATREVILLRIQQSGAPAPRR